MKTIASIGSLLLCFAMAAPAIANDTGDRYPTSDEAFYVLACMEMNGHDAVGLHKCSCAINAVEAQLPYQQYSDAVLVFAMRQAGGERAAIFRDTAPMKEIADRFIRAQSQANQQCFGSSNNGGAAPKRP
jgi:hypothetical protein